jgi:hypothetical protein
MRAQQNKRRLLMNAGLHTMVRKGSRKEFVVREMHLIKIFNLSNSSQSPVGILSLSLAVK